MKNYVQFVTTPSSDTSGNLLVLHFDDRRYLVGRLVEGAQRAILEREVGLRKVSDVLLTGRTEWANIGGLIGSILTMADAKNTAADAQEQARLQKIKNLRKLEEREGGLPPLQQATLRKLISDGQALADGRILRLYGAPNLKFAVACARRFVFRTGTPLKITEFSQEEGLNTEPARPWSDDNVIIWPIPVLPTSQAQRSADFRPAHSRKRSYDEISEAPDMLQPSTSATPRQTLQQAADASGDVVAKMFNSDWSLDKLIEQPLREVKMPATIFVKDSESGQLARYEGPLPGGESEVPDINVLVRTPWPGATTTDLPGTATALTSVSYVIKNLPQRGKFLKEKAELFKLAEKSMYGELIKGNSVKTIDGETVTPEMVMAPGKDGGGFVIADIPSIEYLEPFLSRTEWHEHDVMKGVGAFIWSLGPGVVNDSRLKSFVQQTSQYQHIVSAPEMSTDNFAFQSVTNATVRHHAVDDDCFPLLVRNQRKDFELSKWHTDLETIPAQPGLRVQLEPSIAVQDDDLMPEWKGANALDIFQETELQTLKTQAEGAAHDTTAQNTWKERVPFQDVEIITLGTGSSHPGKYRNVSGTLVRVPGCGSYILDAGEGTMGTMKRLFPPEELRTILTELKAIWVSHLHADHHLGVVSVIRAWYDTVWLSDQANNDLQNDQHGGRRLAIISDGGMLDYLREYSTVEDYGFSKLQLISVTPPNEVAGLPLTLKVWDGASFKEVILAKEALLQPLGLQAIQSVYVSHCRGAQAVSITTTSGFKFSYSGDCRPSNSFAVIGRDSHVLIHEATFEDELRGEALAKKHSTVGEALIVGAKMNARSVVLTHFSQRYPKMAPLGAAGAKKTNGSGDSHGMKRDAQALESILGDKEDLEAAKENSTGIEEPLENPNGAPKPPVSQTNDEASSRAGHSYNPDPTNRSQPLLESEIRELLKEKNIRVVMAFDYMRLKLANFPRLEAKQPVLRLLYDKLQEREDMPSEEAEKDDKASAQAGKGSGGAPKHSREAKEEHKQKQRDKAARKAAAAANT